MSEPMTTDDLAAIRARVEAATPGPWGYWGQGWVAPESDPRCDPVGVPQNLIPRTEADATFIAHARTDVPDLLAEVERLREALRVGIELDNHHNAAMCPYCGALLATAETERDAARAEVAALREAVEGLAAEGEAWGRGAAVDLSKRLRAVLAGHEHRWIDETSITAARRVWVCAVCAATTDPKEA